MVDRIEEILQEAHSYGIREDVIAEANRLWYIFEGIEPIGNDRASAYEEAFITIMNIRGYGKDIIFKRTYR